MLIDLAMCLYNLFHIFPTNKTQMNVTGEKDEKDYLCYFTED